MGVCRAGSGSLDVHRFLCPDSGRHPPRRGAGAVWDCAAVFAISHLCRTCPRSAEWVYTAVPRCRTLFHDLVRGILWHSNAGFREPCDWLHPVRGRSAIHGGRQVFQQSGAVACRGVSRGRGQGVDFCQRVHGVNVRLGHLERADNWGCVDPGDEKNRIFRPLRCRDRGLRLDRGGSDAADHGGHGLCDRIVA